MKPINYLAGLGLAIAACGKLAAQSQVALPTHADLVDGHHSVSTPFGVPGFRTQLLLDLASIAPTGAVLTGIRFRADRTSMPLAATSVPNVTVSVSPSTIVPGNLGTVFAANATGPSTTVFQGTVNLTPHSNGFAGPLPWDISIPFASPFVVTQPANLLVDIVGNNAPDLQPSFWLDAVQQGGSATQFGQGGNNPSFDTLNLLVSTGNSLDPRQLTIGRTVTFTSTLSFSSPPGVLALGTEPTPVPVDLGAFGAPTNLLYVDPILVSAHAWTSSFIGFFSSQLLPIPNDVALVDARIVAQSLIFDPAANALGLILSPAMETRIGDPLEPLLLQQLDATDPAAASGTLLDFSFGSTPEFGATPILLEGVFF